MFLYTRCLVIVLLTKLLDVLCNVKWNLSNNKCLEMYFFIVIHWRRSNAIVTIVRPRAHGVDSNELCTKDEHF